MVEDTTSSTESLNSEGGFSMMDLKFRFTLLFPQFAEQAWKKKGFKVSLLLTLNLYVRNR